MNFGAVRVDAAVSEAVLAALQPLGVEAALRAWEGRSEEGLAEERLARSALEEARYRAGRAQAQFEAIEPGNHNVFHNLVSKWERCLVEVRNCEERLAALEARRQRAGLTPHERATPPLRKAVLRAALVEIIATLEDNRIRLLLHWKGGDHTELEVVRYQPGQTRWGAARETVELVRELSRSLSDPLIASLLNRLGERTGKGNAWTRTRVCSFRASHGIAVYREGERRERGELVLAEAAERLGVATWQLQRLIRTGTLPARQACKGAPWLIAETALETPEVRAALSGKGPLTADPNQQNLDFQ